MIKISVVVPAYNEEKYIERCLDSVIKYAGPDVEIIVVDNNSTDKTPKIAGSKPGVTVVHEPRKGTSNARQTGAEKATGEIVAYLDADSQIEENWFPQIRKAFADHKVVLMSGPYKYYESEKYHPSFLNWMWLLFVPLAYWITGYVGNGGNCVLRKSALEKIGGNDRSIVFYGDDTDLAKRMHTVGKTVWKNSFTVISSARRFDEVGIKLYFTYLINYWWVVLFRHPFTKGDKPVNSQKGSVN